MEEITTRSKARNNTCETEKGEKKGSKERTQKYRERLAQNEERMKLVREKDRLRKKLERDNERKANKQNASKAKAAREKKRLEMQRYRARKKEKETRVGNVAEEEKKRSEAVVRAQKIKTADQKAREAREKKKLAVRKEDLKKKKAVVRTQKWRLRLKMHRSQTNSTDDQHQGTPFSSPSVQSRALKRAKESLPKTPVKRARIVEKLASSPRVSAVLQQKGTAPTGDATMAQAVLSNLRKKLHDTKPKGGLQRDKLRAYKILKGTLSTVPRYAQRSLKKYFGLKSRITRHHEVSWWQAHRRKLRKDRINDTTKSFVKSFYLSPEISREVPCKKDALISKEGDGTGDKALIQKNIMVMTLSEAFSQFKIQHPDKRIGFTTFKKLKPPNVRKVSETSRRTCLCTACSNIALKAEAIKKFVSAQITKDLSVHEDLKGLSQVTKSSLSDGSICSYTTNPTMSCIDRECPFCKDNLSNLLQPLAKFNGDSVTWCHWEYVDVLQKDGKSKRCISCIEKLTSVKEFVECTKDDLVTFPSHLFRARWQHEQMANCQSTLKENEVMLCMDFSENYKCRFQNEVQSGYFDQMSVTIHPTMAYYLEAGCLVKHAIIGISPDTRHVANLVKVFEDSALDILRQQPAFSHGIKTVKEWTDGCSCQYKSKVAFADISLRSPQTARNYFETSHGKGVSDGLGSVVKNACFRAVVAGKAILSDAKAVFKYCHENLAHGPKVRGTTDPRSGRKEISKWDISYIEQAIHDRPEVAVSTLKGCRQFHAVKGTNTPYQLKVRELSCYCSGCTSNTNCCNQQWVKEWSIRSMKQLQAQSDADLEDPDQKTPQQETSTQHPTETAEHAEESCRGLKEGDYVAIYLLRKRRRVSSKQLFMAQFKVVFCVWKTSGVHFRCNCISISNRFNENVVSVIDREVEVRFMEKASSTDELVYRWPSSDDMSWESKAQVLKVCTAPKFIPEKSNSRYQVYQFDENDIAQVQLKLAKA